MTSWSWMVWPNRSMSIARRLGCRVVGLTLSTAGLPNTLRPVHQADVVGCVLPTCAQGLVDPSSRWLGEGENKWSSSWGLVLLFVNPGVCPSGQHLDSHSEGGIVTVISVHPARLCTSPSRGRARWVGGRRWPLSGRRQPSGKVSFYFPFVFFFGKKALL